MRDLTMTIHLLPNLEHRLLRKPLLIAIEFPNYEFADRRRQTATQHLTLHITTSHNERVPGAGLVRPEFDHS